MKFVLFVNRFVTTVPSWVNEKKPSVNVNKSVWLSTFLCNVIFFAVGISGCLAFSDHLIGPATGLCKAACNGISSCPTVYGNVTCANSIMQIFTSNQNTPSVIASNKYASFIMQLSVYLFPVVAILSSIPVYSIVIKYNCMENGFSKTFSTFWGVIFPWLIALPLCHQPNALNQFITFSSLIFVSFTDFVIPWALYIWYEMLVEDAYSIIYFLLCIYFICIVFFEFFEFFAYAYYSSDDFGFSRPF